MNIFIENLGMGKESFEVLFHTASRLFANREIKLSELKSVADYTVKVSLNCEYSNDRYTIEPFAEGVVLSGANDASAHAAFGRFLMESTFDGRGGFVPTDRRIDFTPKRPLRGMYFATHFYNFYHTAPIEKVYEVIENLALEGCNNILVWFDMHHFGSTKDEGAQALIERLREIIRFANKIVIKGSLTMLSNEGFASSPKHLRASWEAIGNYHMKPDGHYHVEICPSKEGGLEEIIRERREVLECFADLDIAYCCYWPYDQGGCTCPDCEPWGANGFIKLLPAFKKVQKEILPNSELIISTWYFDRFIKGEWDAFYPYLESGELGDAAYIMSFFFGGVMPECISKKGIPSGYKFIDFPEISMYSCTPWGGFGASALPHFLGVTNERNGALYSGGFPYSEGIFEDVNKFISLSYYSGLYENSNDAVRAYVRFNYCVDGEALDELTEVIIKSEVGLARVKDPERVAYQIQNGEHVSWMRSVMKKYNATLPEKIRSSYKFRLYYLRSIIDSELLSHGGAPNDSELCREAMREVNEIYHATERTASCVKAPLI